MEPNIISISSNSSSVRQEVFPLGQWTITTRKGIIMQSKCTCQHSATTAASPSAPIPAEKMVPGINRNTAKPIASEELCNICDYFKLLPQLHSMPDMLFNNNILRIEHYTGTGLEFNALDALKLVEETKDPLKVAVADGWQSARADCPFAKSVVKPFDWTFTTNYRGTLLTAICKNKQRCTAVSGGAKGLETSFKNKNQSPNRTRDELSVCESIKPHQQQNDDRSGLTVEETNERIDVNKLKIREEILFYDDVILYEDELADHGTAQYSVKVRVMPKSFFILARFYLRIDGVLARINDTRIHHELNKRYLLREYTNREAKLNSLNLPVSTLVNPNELAQHLPIIQSSLEKLVLH